MQIGDSFEVKRVVDASVTAEAVGSGGMRVFGTPFMIGMMENAAFRLMQRELPEGKSSVGAMINVEHTAPTPIGMAVTVKATVTAISENGKMMDFSVEAWDEAGPIGAGTHRRAVVDVQRFLTKCESKRGLKQ